jgi:RsiW-degrading membrane proteinase PrsW (M82 family)
MTSAIEEPVKVLMNRQRYGMISVNQPLRQAICSTNLYIYYVLCKKRGKEPHSSALFYTFAAQLHQTIQHRKMENIQNTRGKGYCILYIIMGLFFLISLILMLYNRSGVLEFPKL